MHISDVKHINCISEKAISVCKLKLANAKSACKTVLAKCGLASVFPSGHFIRHSDDLAYVFYTICQPSKNQWPNQCVLAGQELI